jgi:ABC-type nitrate/sulfonate/bicarbonate transport system substrate-binding protein
VILNRLGGGDAILIGVYNAVLTIDCHARPDIHSIADLKGHTIAVTRLATSSYFAGVMTLASAGLKPEDVTWLQSGGVSESAAVLMAGQADAAMIGYPSSLQVVQAGYPRLASPAQLGEYGLFPNNAIAVRDAWLREPANHDVALRFLRAVNHGLQVARTDDAALRRVLRKYTQIEDEGTLQATVDYTREYFPTTLRVDERGIRNALRLLDHPAAADADPRQFFDNSLVDQIAG